MYQERFVDDVREAAKKVKKEEAGVVAAVEQVLIP